MDKNYCTLYIVRHGQTDWNAKKLVQGQTDVPLNKAGEKQAKELGEKLKGITFDSVYSSDLLRAKKTAELISLEKKLVVGTSKLLRERRYGQLEGKPRTELDKIHKIWRKLDKIQRAKYKPFKQYETDEDSVSRLITFLREIAVSYLNKTVLVVSHGGVMRALLNHLSGETYLGGAVSNSGYIKLKSDGVDFFIEELNGINEPE